MEAICYFNKEYFLSELQRAGVIKNDEENDAHSLTLEKVPNVTIGLVLAVRSLKQFENQIILNWIRKGKEVTSLIDDQFALYDKLSIYLQSNVYSEDDIVKWKQILNETKYVFPESKSRGWAQIFGDTPILLDSDDSHESNIDLEGTELTVESPIRSENDRNNEYLEMTMASKEINESKANRPHFSKHSNFLSDDICEDDICDMNNSLDFECSIDSNNEIPEMRENDMLNLSVKDELVESQKAEIWTLKVSEQKAGIWTFKVSEPPSVPEKEKEKKKKKKKENITPNLKEYFNSGSLVEIKKNCGGHNNLLCTLCSVIGGDKDMPQHLAGKRHRAENEFTWKDKRRAKKVMENHAMTGYFLYLNETREQIKMDNPGITVKEIPRRAGELWNAIEDKSKWLKLEKSVQEESAYALVEKKAGGSGDNIVVDVPKNASIAEEAVTKMSGPVEVDCITLSDSEDDDPSSEPKKTNIGQGPVFSASIAAANTLASAHIPSERDNTHGTDGNEKSYNDSDDERKFKRSKFEQEHFISNSDSSYSPVQEERKVKRKKIVHKRMLSRKDSSDSSIQERKMKRQKSVRKHFISSIDSSDSPGQDVDPDSDDGSGNSGNDSDDERNSKRSRFESNCFVSSGKEMLDWLNDSEKSSNDSDDEIKSKRSKFAREHFISSDPDSSYSPGQEERKVNKTKFVHKHMLSSTDSSDSPGHQLSLPPTAPPLQNQLFSQPPPPLPHQHPSPPPPPPTALQHQLPLLSPPPQALASSRIADSFREMTQSQNNVNQVSPNNESLLCEVANKVAKHTLYKDTAYIIAQITTELENTGIPPTLEIIGILSLKISEQHKMEALLYEVAEKVAKVALNKDTDYIISQITTELENSGIPTTLEIIGKIVLEISDHHKRNTMEGNLC